MTELHVARFAELDAATLYALLRLRSEVFIVEQLCAYPDIDGRDLEPGTRHLWLTSAALGAEPLAYLRILVDAREDRIGRVCVSRDARRAGHAATLLAEAVRLIGAGDAVLHAQTYAIRLYERVGFVVDGPEYIEDGIPHVPMRRARQIFA